jgi:hypothetical protein
MQESTEAPFTRTRDFAQALLHGEVSGYAVCAKPLRFSQLPESVATTFAELGEMNCYYVFEKQAEAEQRLAQIPSNDALGWIFSVKEVSYLRHLGPNDGPKLDPADFPFEMKGFVVNGFIPAGSAGVGRRTKLGLRTKLVGRTRSHSSSVSVRGLNR